MKDRGHKKCVLYVAHILKSKKTYQNCFVLLLCLYGLLHAVSITNIVYKSLGLVLFSGASIAVFFRFNWFKYFFYAWAFIAPSYIVLMPRIFTCYVHIEGVGTYWLVPSLLEAMFLYGIGRLINRLEPKKLTENWIDVLAIAAFISILSTAYAPSLAGYLNDLYHFVPTRDALFDNAEGLDWASPYAYLGLFLWPAWLWDFIVTACLAFLLTLPFYRLWRLKHTIVTAVFFPVIHFTPMLICIAYYSIKQADAEGYFGPEALWLGKAVIPLGVLFGGLCTVVLKRLLKTRL